MKRILVFVVIWIFLINIPGSISRTSAAALPPRGDLPWRVEPVINNTDIKSISVAYDSYTKKFAPMIAYHDTITNQFREAVFLGDGQGDCGVDNAWKCNQIDVWWSHEGEYNDVAFAPNFQNYYDITFYAFYAADDDSLYLKGRYSSGKHAGDKLLTFGSYPGGTIGSPPTLAIGSDGTIHIAVVVDGTPNDYLVYIHYVGVGEGNCPGGDNFVECDTILMGPNIAEDPSIAVEPNGTPRIAYYDPANGALGYAYPYSNPIYSNCGPNTDWRCFRLYELLDSGKFPSLAISDETYIGFYNPGTGALVLAHYVGGNGNCGYDYNGSGYAFRWQCDEIENVGSGVTKMGLSLVLDGSVPVLAYMDSTGYQPTVRLAQPLARSGMPNGNCGPVDLFYTWYCQTIASGQYPFGGEIDMAVNGSGALHLAYTEQNVDEHQIYLWSARQYFPNFLPVLRK